MQLLFNLILLNSIWTLALTIATQEGMLLYNFREWADKKEGKWAKPLITCHLCMPSLHSPIAYGLAIGMGIIKTFSWSLVFMWPMVVCGASLLNGFVWYLLNLLIKKVEYYEWLQELDQDKKIES